MPHQGPDATMVYPLEHHNKLVFLRNIITRPNIEVGDYTYYDDHDDPYNFEKNVLYHFDFLGDKLIIGKFCAIASGVQFIMNGANHEINTISTYPFAIFENGWEVINQDADLRKKYPYKGDTVIGNDVWIGYGCTIMPGIKIGNGVIIASRSVITKNVPDYAIIGGNPAQTIRMRYDEETISKLLKIAWWDWSIEKITRNIRLINSTDIDALEAAV